MGFSIGNLIDRGGEWLLGDLHRSISGSGLTTAEIQANEFNAAEAQKQRDWQTEMDNTKVQRSVQDMQAAGVNPAMMMGGSGVTASTPSGAAASAGAPRRGNVSLDSIMNMAMIGQRFKESNANISNIKADTALKLSEANKTGAEEENIRINNDYLKEFNELRNAGMAASNDLTRSQYDEVRSNIRKIDSETILNGVKAETEESQQIVNAALAAKHNMDVYVAAELLPYQKNLSLAQTDNQRAQAEYALVQAAYDRGLIDNGYIESMCRSMGAEADYQEFLTAIKTGDPEGKVYEGKFAKFVGRVAAGCGALIEASGIGNVLKIGISSSNSKSESTVHKK